MSEVGPQKVGDVSVNRAGISSEIGSQIWNFGRWLTNEDEYSDIIISSRIRLARNLKGTPFPNRIKTVQARKILHEVRNACSKCPSLGESRFYEIRKLSKWDRKYFVERRLASPQLIESDKPAMLVVGPNEILSIMVNEEDHLRMQSIEAGLGIENAWRTISTVDDEIEEHLVFSYSSKFGYLTACPTNIGTGLRVSIFVHLPALSLQENVNEVINELPTSEIAVRGFYGEGSESVGNIFQISNQLTLGRTEENIVERITRIAMRLTDLEREARDDLLKNDRIKLEDAVYRAVGLLQKAKIMSSLEAMNLISNVRLGYELGLLKNLSRMALHQLMVLVQPAHLQKLFEKELHSQERDVVRAKFIRQYLKI
ncbi:protein arginine kinase [candidate division KSB1 bacterium]|nr:protein arginine kinase [candidate division KSB1 bacterium]NIR69575.1 protein arginine kinase [candidate division KSB1 bacterium]NIS25923.1 protein arginine kinase [candidate division KSB1 bacterium]NIT72804.1 protein arginine kinase [candidate division KSB1 bacterium]NIU26611.1 protein arginine kinase [candidate division KSB1 bacterium]